MENKLLFGNAILWVVIWFYVGLSAGKKRIKRIL